MIAFVKAVLCVLALPISVVPVVAAKPLIEREYASFQYHHGTREAKPAPRVATPFVRPLPDYDGAVPVLVYHGINDHEHNRYTVTRKAFAEQMAMLAGAHFRAISPAQYLRYLRGDRRGLPTRPVLITFDDGRFDSFEGADQILRRYRMRATMFVITAAPGSSRYYLNWDQLREMQRSGRWDLELHAHRGHVNIPSGPGKQGPYYANRRFSAGRLESLSAYRRRVSEDVLAGKRIMSQQIPGYRPQLMALPYGSYGQQESNDPSLQRFFRAWLLRNFKVILTQSDPTYSTGRTLGGEARRYEIYPQTTTGQLYHWLDQGLPYRAWTRAERGAHLAAGRPCLRSLRVPAGSRAALLRADGRLIARDRTRPRRLPVRLSDTNPHYFQLQSYRGARVLRRGLWARACGGAR